MKDIVYATLDLFNGVPALADAEQEHSINTEFGLVIDRDARWLESNIEDYARYKQSTGYDLNRTFHKSWAKIASMSDRERITHQIIHYASTYGTNFEGNTYLPDEVLRIPNYDLTFKVIHAYDEDALIKKCLDILISGIALKDETIHSIFLVLKYCNYIFTGKEGIRNREALMHIADNFGPCILKPEELVRYLVFKSTGSTLLIKNMSTYQAIAKSAFNPRDVLLAYGLTKISCVFNRYKPIFMALKSKCRTEINYISKASKTNHVPVTENPLNKVTTTILTESEMPWLENATVFAIFRAMHACNTRMRGQNTFVYKVRNGKSFAKFNPVNKVSDIVCQHNYIVLTKFLKAKFDMTKSVFLPKDILFGLPTSEKQFIGNVPIGTKIIGDSLAVGVYWRNDWGARDIDLSGMSISGKVGWNASYRQHGYIKDEYGLMYSGDITNAPNGAVEYLWAGKYVDNSLVQTNIFSGKDTCKYRIIVGDADNINRDYMMNPNNLKFYVETNSVQKQTILGMIMPYDGRVAFVLFNTGSGQLRVSGGKNTHLFREALIQEWTNNITLNDVLYSMGVTIVESPEEADIDLSIEALQKDTFISMFEVK